MSCGKERRTPAERGSAARQEEQAVRGWADRKKSGDKSVQDPGPGDEGTVFKEREASTWSPGAPKY